MPKRFRQLDFLRGVSILLVLLHHADREVLARAPLLKPLFLIAAGGWMGVDLFFTLSGFLVSGLIFRELKATGRFGAVRFLVRRGFKIYPSFYLFLVATLLLRPLIDPSGIRPDLGWEALFLQNYLPAFWGHTWSLAVEEHFYLLLAMTLFVFSLRPAGGSLKRYPLLVVCVMAVVMLLRAFTYFHMPFDLKSHVMATHLRIDALFFGSLLAYLQHFHASRFTDLIRRYRAPLFVAGFALIAPCFLKGHGGWHTYIVGLTFTYIGCGFLLLATFALDEASGLMKAAVIRAISWIGLYSYSIYLWHMLAHELLAQLMPESLTRSALFVGSSIACGIGLAHLVELPALKLRERLVSDLAARPSVASEGATTL